MARRVSFSTAQPITILGFWSASILLIALIAVASNDLRAPGVQDQALTQAYYYAIFAAALYQMISCLMCVTVWGAYRGHYSREFKLTMSQRTLMLQTISFMAYLLIGAAIYSHIEGWDFLDAMYWADFTCLTVGIGDYAPATDLGRGLLFPYAFGGIVSLGLVVGSIRSMVLDRGKKKLYARMTETTRKSILKQINAKNDKSVGAKVRGLDKHTASTLALDPTSCKMTEKERRRAEFEAMRAVQDLATSKRKWISLAISGGIFVLLWFIGALVFYKAEKNQNWSYFGSLYFAYTSLLTIGYGDFSPFSNSGKPFFVFWSLLAVPALTILISDLGETVIKIIKDFTIYLGEITILPSDEGGLNDSLKYGIYKLTGGKVGNKVRGKGDSHSEGKSTDIPHILQQSEKLSPRQQDVEALQHGLDSLASEEKREEQEARTHGNKVAEDEHHYRYLLIAEMKKMYSYVNSEPPRKFTYDEWAYYLRLLGEDEYDERYHRRAPVEVRNGKGDNEIDRSGSSPNQDGGEDTEDTQQEAPTNQFAKDKDDIKEWSWLGNRSPLMGDKDEAEWILERLFAVLERDLKKQKDHYSRSSDRHLHSRTLTNEAQKEQGNVLSRNPSG